MYHVHGICGSIFKMRWNWFIFIVWEVFSVKQSFTFNELSTFYLLITIHLPMLHTRCARIPAFILLREPIRKANFVAYLSRAHTASEQNRAETSEASEQNGNDVELYTGSIKNLHGQR